MVCEFSVIYDSRTYKNRFRGLGESACHKNGDTPSLLPESMHSLQSIFKNVNPKDRRFLKYVPDGFLNDAQKQAKNEALQMERSEYASYGTVKLSDRDDGGMSNRELLANALEETVQSDGEARDAGAVQGADHRRSDFTEKLFHTA